MALLNLRSQFTDGRVNVAPCNGSEVRAIRAVLSLTTNPSANDTAHLVDLPPDHLPVSVAIDSSDMDTNVGPTMTVSVGTMTAAKTDLTDVFILDSTVVSAGTATNSNALIAMARTTAAQTGPMSIGVKFANAAATFAAGSLGVTILYRRADPTHQ